MRVTSMRAIIDKAAKYSHFATRQMLALKNEPLGRTRDLFEKAYLQGAKDVMNLPLADKLTEEDKERINDFLDTRFPEGVDAEEIITDLFGNDFFEKGGEA